MKSSGTVQPFQTAMSSFSIDSESNARFVKERKSNQSDDSEEKVSSAGRSNTKNILIETTGFVEDDFSHTSDEDSVPCETEISRPSTRLTQRNDFDDEK